MGFSNGADISHSLACVLNDKIAAFESAEMMLPHMVRFTKDKLRAMKLKKIKALSKKLSKKGKDNTSVILFLFRNLLFRYLILLLFVNKIVKVFELKFKDLNLVSFIIFFLK